MRANDVRDFVRHSLAFIEKEATVELKLCRSQQREDGKNLSRRDNLFSFF